MFLSLENYSEKDFLSLKVRFRVSTSIRGTISLQKVWPQGQKKPKPPKQPKKPKSVLNSYFQRERKLQRRRGLFGADYRAERSTLEPWLWCKSCTTPYLSSPTPFQCSRFPADDQLWSSCGKSRERKEILQRGDTRRLISELRRLLLHPTSSSLPILPFLSRRWWQASLQVLLKQDARPKSPSSL